MAKSLTLNDCVELIIDHRGKTPLKLGGNWVNGNGYRALSAKNIERGKLKNIESIRQVDESLYKRWMPQEIQKGDILLTSEGPLGEALLWNTDEKIVLSQRLFALRAKPDVVIPEYLYAYVTSPAFQKELEARATGSTVKGIRQSELRKTRLFIPNIQRQRVIGNFISSIDKKIELNRRMNETLEQIGQALFKRWFVDFEFPNEDGKPYKSSGGKMKDSPLGPIPEDWKVGTLEEISKNFDSKRIPLSSRERESRKGPYPYYGATSIMDYVDGYLFDGEYLLMAEDGTVINSDNTPVLQYVWGQFWVNNHAHVLQGQEGVPLEYLYLLLRQTDVKRLVTGAVQLKINKSNMNSLQVVIPNKPILNTFEQIIKPLFAHRRLDVEQITVLTELRDSLLPRLISGRLSI